MSNKLKRIDPASVPALFERFEMGPIQESFFNGSCGCCINTILAAAVVGLKEAMHVANRLSTYDDAGELARLSGLDRDYATGLAEGWDEHPKIPTERMELKGYRDGLAAWKACQREADK